jgi:hypothetical protein
MYEIALADQGKDKGEMLFLLSLEDIPELSRNSPWNTSRSRRLHATRSEASPTSQNHARGPQRGKCRGNIRVRQDDDSDRRSHKRMSIVWNGDVIDLPLAI